MRVSAAMTRASSAPVPGITRATGFSLIEVLMAVLVLAVGFLGISQWLLVGWRDQRFAQRQLVAQTLMADFADRLRASRDVRGLSQEFSAAARDHLAPAHHEARITFAPATGPDDPARYRISLRWREADAADWQAEASTLVLAPGPVAG
jgi:type IV pilus modification protein PilV